MLKIDHQWAGYGQAMRVGMRPEQTGKLMVDMPF